MTNFYKNRVIRIEDIPTVNAFKYEQRLKPYVPIFIFLAANIVCFVFDIARPVTIAFILFMCYVLFFVPDRTSLMITDKFVIEYHEDGKECSIYYYDEVLSWKIEEGKTSMDHLLLNMKDGFGAQIPTSNPTKVVKVLRKFIEEKEIKLRLKADKK